MPGALELLQQPTLMVQVVQTVLRWVLPQQAVALGRAALRFQEMADQAEELVLLMPQTKLGGLLAQRGKEMQVVPNTGLAVTPRRVVAVAVLVLLVVMLPQILAAQAAMAPRHRLPDQQLRGAAAVEVANVRQADQAAAAARVAAVTGRRIPQISQLTVAQTLAAAVAAVAGRMPAAAAARAV